MRLEPGPLTPLNPDAYDLAPEPPEFVALALEDYRELAALDAALAEPLGGAAAFAADDLAQWTGELLAAPSEELAVQGDWPIGPMDPEVATASSEVEQAIVEGYNLVPGEAWEDAPAPYVPPPEDGGFTPPPEPGEQIINQLVGRIQTLEARLNALTAPAPEEEEE